MGMKTAQAGCRKSVVKNMREKRHREGVRGGRVKGGIMKGSY